MGVTDLNMKNHSFGEGLDPDEASRRAAKIFAESVVECFGKLA